MFSSYVLILVWLGLMGYVGYASADRLKETIRINGRPVLRYQWLFAFLVFLPVILMAGFRGDVGDSLLYRITYRDLLPTSFAELHAYVQSIGKDEGFYYLSGMIKRFFGSNYRWYFLILAFMHGLPLVYIYRRYSEQYVLSAFLFIASTDYISWMYNGIRQFTAVTIIFLAFPLLLNRRYLLFAAAVLFASVFHQSCLLVLPSLFFVEGKAFNQRTLIAAALTLAVVVFVESFTPILDSMLSNTQYVNVVSDWEEWQDDGTNPIRVLVYSVPTIIAMVGYRYIQAEDDPLINTCTNMSILSTGLYVISMVTSGIFIGRLPIYFSLFNYILLPWEITHIFNEESAQLITLGMIVFYLAFYYYQMHMMFGLF